MVENVEVETTKLKDEPKKNRTRMLSVEHDEVKEQRRDYLHHLNDSPRKLKPPSPKTKLSKNVHPLAANFLKKTLSTTSIASSSFSSTSSTRPSSPSSTMENEDETTSEEQDKSNNTALNKFAMIQAKVTTMGTMRDGGARRRKSILLVEKPLTGDQRRDILDRIGSLDVLSEESKDRFAETLEARVYGKGETIMEEGDVGEEFFIIETGKVEVTRVDQYRVGVDKVIAKVRREKREREERRERERERERGLCYSLRFIFWSLIFLVVLTASLSSLSVSPPPFLLSSFPQHTAWCT